MERPTAPSDPVLVLDQALRRPVTAILLLAAAARVAWALVGVPDPLVDSYENALLDRLALLPDSGGRAPPGGEFVAPPLFRALASLLRSLVGGNGLLPGHLVSLVAGTAAAGVTARAALLWTGRSTVALLTGVMVALNPWHVAHSWINTPEAIGSLWVALALAGLGGRSAARGWVLPVAGLCGALTGAGTALLLCLLASIALFAGRRSRGIALGVGLLVGIAGWTVRIAGDPETRSPLTSWMNPRPGPGTELLDFPLALTQVLTPLLVLGALFLLFGIRRNHGPWMARLMSHYPSIPWIATTVMLLLVGVLQPFLVEAPGPRDLVVLIPVASLGVAQGIAALAPARQVRWGTALLSVVAGAFILQLPTFPARVWKIEGDRAGGRFLAGATLPAGPIWIDSPVAAQVAGLDPRRIVHSSDLIPDSLPAGVAQETVAAALRTRDIRTVYRGGATGAAASRGGLGSLWPAAREEGAFVAEGLRFTPVFIREPWRTGPGGGPLDRLRAGVEGRHGTVVVWRVESLSPPEPGSAP